MKNRKLDLTDKMGKSILWLAGCLAGWLAGWLAKACPISTPFSLE